MRIATDIFSVVPISLLGVACFGSVSDEATRPVEPASTPMPAARSGNDTSGDAPLPLSATSPVGMLLTARSFGNNELLEPTCSVVLIADDAALSAGHCVSSDASYRVFWPGEGVVELDGAPIIHEGYEVGPLGPKNDIALLRLNNSTKITVPLGLANYGGEASGYVHGYAKPVDSASGMGITGLGVRFPIEFRRELINKDEPILSLKQIQSAICQMNSGGAVVVDSEAGPNLVGVISKATAGKNPAPMDCFEFAFAARTWDYKHWIEQNGVKLESRGRSEPLSIQGEGPLDLEGFQKTAQHALKVSPDTKRIIVSVNGAFELEGDVSGCIENVHVSVRGPLGEIQGDNIVGPVWSWSIEVKDGWAEQDLVLNIQTPQKIGGCEGLTYSYQWRVIELQ